MTDDNWRSVEAAALRDRVRAAQNASLRAYDQIAELDAALTHMRDAQRLAIRYLQAVPPDTAAAIRALERGGAADAG